MMWKGGYNPHLSEVMMDEVKRKGCRVTRTRDKIGAPTSSKYVHRGIQHGKVAVEITPHAAMKICHHWN